MRPAPGRRRGLAGLALLAGVGLATPTLDAGPRLLRVGPERALTTPSAAARVARSGDVVLIDAGLYPGDVAVWRQDGLTLRAAGGRVQLAAAGRVAEGKGIWVIRGQRTTVEGIEFSGARARSRNGAGIRMEGRDLVVRDCRFHDNEMGILTNPSPGSSVLIEHSEFARNTVDHRRHGRLGHNIYIGHAGHFTLRASHVHDARTGHNVKSRARQNHILYNRIMDGQNASSYLVDLPEGGHGLVMGNLLRQGAVAENRALIAFAAEAGRNDLGQTLHVVHNTAVDDTGQGIFVHNHSLASANLVNNLLVGTATALQGPGQVLASPRLRVPGLRERRAGDYRLRPGSPALDRGLRLEGGGVGIPPRPTLQYRHPRALEVRPDDGRPDLGAYELARELNGPDTVEPR